jgi:malonate transporter and related proteins
VTLLTLVSVHALILLTAGSVVLELAVARETAAGGERPNLLATAWSAIKGALIHPIPLPILCGLLFAQTGWTLPTVVDKPLQLLGSAFGPLALVLVGVSWRAPPWPATGERRCGSPLSKNLVLPVLVGLSAWAVGITGLPLTVMVVAAACPWAPTCSCSPSATRWPGAHHRQHGPVHRHGAVHAEPGHAVWHGSWLNP